MSRIRTVKPEFWTNPKTAHISRDARLLFIGLLNEADDEGRLYAAPRGLIGALFRHDDDVDETSIRRWIRELTKVGLVEPYEVDGIGYLWVVGFTTHQKVSHPSPSRLPGLPHTNGSGELPENLTNNTGEALELLAQEGNREQGTGSKEQVGRIFDAWRESTGKPRAVLDSQRQNLIRKAFKLGFNEEILILAVQGWAASAWHSGDNPSGKAYNDLHLILRDAAHIEQFAGYAQAGADAPTVRGGGSLRRALERRRG